MYVERDRLMPPDRERHRWRSINGKTFTYDPLDPKHISSGMRLHIGEQIYRRLGEARGASWGSCKDLRASYFYFISF